jgi:hypothetical protein
MMGLPEGWVTDLDLPRTAQLRALGNGVVPAQATHALELLTVLHVNATCPINQNRPGRAV